MASEIYGIIEAEDFDIINNFKVISGNYASGGKALQHLGSGTATISTDVEEKPGTYDIRVTYFDENDGASTSRLYVDDQLEASWTWNKQLGSGNAGTATKTTYTVSGVQLDRDATIRIEGEAKGNEQFRIDRVDLLPPSDRGGSGSRPAFEGAEGYGSDTIGGRGGWIVKVTNLNDSGVGSLRWALEDLDVPRIVVFEVGGRINLKKQIYVNGDVTVAGQTALGDGITITGGRLHVVDDNVIIRGLHIRPGSGSGDDAIYRDAISVGTEGTTVENVIIDSNSFSWAVDENTSVWSGAKNVTYSNNIIAEGLNNSIHPDGKHSHGMLIGDDSQRITITDNLLASNFHRNPQVNDARNVEFVNNVIYNYGDNGFSGLAGGSRYTTAHVIGNHFIAGDDTANNAPVRLLGKSSGTEYYLKDNLGPTRTSSSQPEIDIAEGSGKTQVSSSKVFGSSNVSPIAAEDVLDHVLANAGARVDGSLDSTDTRIINTVKNDTGSVINSPGNVGGYDTTNLFNAPNDSDGDGIPDNKEASIGSNPSVFDPHGDANGNGYTNIEDYINSLLPTSGGSVGSGGSGGSGSGSGTTDQLIEAETFHFTKGFKIKSSNHASGNAYIQKSGSGEQRAETVFDGADGMYDLKFAYFDEADGVSNVKVFVDGTQVASWNWGRSLGSNYANKSTLTTKTFRDIALDDGDVIEIRGTPDGGEPLRIDSLFIDG